MSSECTDVQLDVELLIREVKKHPCLYDKNDSHYGDPQYRRDKWEEISSVLFKDVWNSYDYEEQDAKCEQVIKRWRNVRACFNRECKRQKDPKLIYGVAYKRRKYIYYNELSFLKSENDTDETSTIDIDLSENSEKENTTLTVKNKFEEPIPDPIIIPKTNANGKRKKIIRIESSSNSEKTNSVDTTDLSVFDRIGYNSVKDKTSNNSDRAFSSPDKVITNMITSTTNSDNTSMNSVTEPSSNSVLINVNETDSTSFALSLVPMLNMLSVDDKVECQIRILSAILPFMKKCRDDGRTGDGGNRKTATSTRQTHEKKSTEDVDIFEIKSEDESDGDL